MRASAARRSPCSLAGAVGRLGLACACAFAGFAYGALLDLSVMVTYGGEQSLDRYLALSARGHPVQRRPRRRELRDRARRRTGAGPDDLALSRAARVHVDLGRGAGAGRCRRGAGARRLAARPGLGPARAAGRPRPAGGGERHRRGREGLARAGAEPRWRLRDGAGVVVQRRHDRLGDARAGGRRPQPARPADGTAPHRSPTCVAAPSGCNSTGDLERTVLALEGAGISPRGFGGRTWSPSCAPSAIGGRLLRGASEPDRVRVLALRAAGAPASELERSATWLRRGAEPRRRLGLSPRHGERPGLHRRRAAGARAAGGGGAAASKGVRYLRGAQRGDGGFALASGGATNSQSTAWAVQGLVAAGVDPGRGHALPGAVRSTTWLRARPRTATTATPRRATRLRSGSPRRRCSP